MFPITVNQNSSQHKMHKGLTYLLFGAVLVALPFILPEFQVGRLNRAIYLAVAVLGLQMVLGYGGLLALGHSAFIGTGAFVTTWLVMDQPFFGGDFWEFWMAIPVSMAVCAAVGALLAIPALKIKGLYLALVTIALATVFPGLAAVETLGIAEATGGVNGRELAGQKLVPPGWAEAIGFSAEEPGRYRYFPVVILALISFWAVSNLIKSRPGRAMVAIRDNETGAAVSGVALTKSKVTSFAISASFGGLAGAMWAMDKGFVAQQDYNFFLAVDLLVALVIGGVATIPGAVVGALIVVFVREFTKGLEVPLGFYTIDGGGPLSQAIFGFILVIVTFFAPGGLVWMFRLVKSKFYRVIPEVPELSEPVVPLGQVEEPALAMS